MTCCRRLQKMLQSVPENAKVPRGPVRAYFGLASSSPDNAASPQSLLRLADQNLEAAKAGQGEGIVAS